MLGVSLHKLCPLDSFGDAFREKKTARKSIPRRVQNWPVGGPKWLLEGLRAALLCQVGTTWPPRPLGSRAWAALGALLGRLWRSWNRLGGSSGVPGRSWAPLGGHFGNPQERI